MSKYTRTAAVGLLFGMALLLIVAIQVQAGPEPPYSAVDAHLPLSMGQGQMIQAVSAPVNASDPVLDSVAAPCESGTCPTSTVSCNQVINWKNDDTNQWDTYGCLDTSIFPTVRFSETFYAITIVSDSVDLGLAIPFARTPPGEIMDHFGAILNTCDSDDCQAATHVKDLTIHQHAIVSNAPKQPYILAIDSPNMNAEGDAIVSCGSHLTGWCDDPEVFSATIQCGNYTFHDNTDKNSADNITKYNSTFYDIDYAFDGPELTYKLVLTESLYFSATLFYSGNEAMPYNNYMSLFLMPEECNQREILGTTGLTGESATATKGTTKRWLDPGTYYVAVDGLHMPYGGDRFEVAVGCTGLKADKTAVDVNGGDLIPGDIIEYAVAVHNTGSLDVENIMVIDGIPAHTTYVANSAATTPPVTVSGPNPLAATWATIGAGETVTLTFRVTVNNTAVGRTIQNSASVSAPNLSSVWEPSVTIGPVSRVPGGSYVYLPIVLKNIK